MNQLNGTTSMTDLLDVYFTDINTGTIVGLGGTILYTFNGGVTWTTQSSGTTVNLSGISFTDANTATAVGDSGIILRTTNGGSNWTIQSIDKTTDLNGISFTNANTGNVVGDGGIILRTTTGGTVTSVKGRQNSKVQLSEQFALEQNYPNPFNPSTTISFNLSTKSFVKLKIFDIIGREVATLINGEMSAGNHSQQWNAMNMSTGVYFYQLQAGSFSETKKLIIIK